MTLTEHQIKSYELIDYAHKTNNAPEALSYLLRWLIASCDKNEDHITLINEALHETLVYLKYLTRPQG